MGVDAMPKFGERLELLVPFETLFDETLAYVNIVKPFSVYIVFHSCGLDYFLLKREGGRHGDVDITKIQT